jgi:hypothetical protein
MYFGQETFHINYKSSELLGLRRLRNSYVSVDLQNRSIFFKIRAEQKEKNALIASAGKATRTRELHWVFPVVRSPSPPNHHILLVI